MLRLQGRSYDTFSFNLLTARGRRSREQFDKDNPIGGALFSHMAGHRGARHESQVTPPPLLTCRSQHEEQHDSKSHDHAPPQCLPICPKPIKLNTGNIDLLKRYFPVTASNTNRAESKSLPPVLTPPCSPTKIHSQSRLFHPPVGQIRHGHERAPYEYPCTREHGHSSNIPSQRRATTKIFFPGKRQERRKCKVHSHECRRVHHRCYRSERGRCSSHSVALPQNVATFTETISVIKAISNNIGSFSANSDGDDISKSRHQLRHDLESSSIFIKTKSRPEHEVSAKRLQEELAHVDLKDQLTSSGDIINLAVSDKAKFANDPKFAIIADSVEADSKLYLETKCQVGRIPAVEKAEATKELLTQANKRDFNETVDEESVFKMPLHHAHKEGESSSEDKNENLLLAACVKERNTNILTNGLKNRHTLTTLVKSDVHSPSFADLVKDQVVNPSTDDINSEVVLDSECVKLDSSLVSAHDSLKSIDKPTYAFSAATNNLVDNEKTVQVGDQQRTTTKQFMQTATDQPEISNNQFKSLQMKHMGEAWESTVTDSLNDRNRTTPKESQNEVSQHRLLNNVESTRDTVATESSSECSMIKDKCLTKKREAMVCHIERPMLKNLSEDEFRVFANELKDLYEKEFPATLLARRSMETLDTAADDRNNEKILQRINEVEVARSSLVELQCLATTEDSEGPLEGFDDVEHGFCKQKFTSQIRLLIEYYDAQLRLLHFYRITSPFSDGKPPANQDN